MSNSFLYDIYVTSHFDCFADQKLEWIKKTKTKTNLYINKHWPMHIILSRLIIIKCLRRYNINFIAQIKNQGSKRLKSLFIITDLRISWDEIWTRVCLDVESVSVSTYGAAHNHKYHLFSAVRPVRVECIKLRQIVRQNTYGIKNLSGNFSVSKEAGDWTKW